jgi:protein SCO1/2
MNRRELLAGKARAKSPSVSLGPQYYTNAVLRTQDNQPVKFYRDLIQDKLVMINFMYTRCQGACPTNTANLVKVQRALGDRVGRDIFMYSITLKPEEDDPAALKKYAEEHGVGPGWRFLTGSDFDLTTIRFRMYRWELPALDFNIEQHVGMARIVNDRINRWSMCPLFARHGQIVDAVSWAEETKPYDVRMQKNRAAQAKIKGAAA